MTERWPSGFTVREFLHESNAIENVHSEKADEKCLSAWNWLRQQDELGHEEVKESHRRIMEDRQPEMAGEYRDCEVYIGNHIPPAPNQVQPRMDELLSWTPKSPYEAVSWHIGFEQIHPFVDGNGRAGRLLYIAQMHKLEEEPILWRARAKQGYYSLFHTDRNHWKQELPCTRQKACGVQSTG
jgi:Fic family protein